MKQFIITALDRRDETTLETRLAYREQHLAALRIAVKARTVLSGGAILDDSGKMIGSSLHTQFESKQAAEDWIKQDIFYQQPVWNPDTLTIQETKLLPIADILS